MHNLLNLLRRLPNRANVHDSWSPEVGASKALHSRGHGGCEHDCLEGETEGGEREGRGGEGRRDETLTSVVLLDPYIHLEFTVYVHPPTSLPSSSQCLSGWSHLSISVLGRVNVLHQFNRVLGIV